MEIATDILNLKKLLGGLNAVADKIGISTGMLNQFLSVFKLPSSIRQSVHERKIDSVAMVFLLSKFSGVDAQDLLDEIINGKITSQELKILLPYRKHHPAKKIVDLLTEIHSSKNIQVSVIQLPLNIVKKTAEQISELLTPIVTAENLIDVTTDKEKMSIKVKKDGEKKLRKIAKEKGLTLAVLMTTLIK